MSEERARLMRGEFVLSKERLLDSCVLTDSEDLFIRMSFGMLDGRFWSDLEIAQTIGCDVGTVILKINSGLWKLRHPRK